MSIGEALNFPFRNGNIYKILPIALIWGIVIYLMVYSIYVGSVLLLFGSGLAVLVFSAVVGGYYVSVISHLQDGHTRLPDIQARGDFGRGVITMIAAIVYFLPLVVLMFIVIFSVVGTTSGDAGGGAFLLVCGAFLLLIPVGLMLWAIFSIAIIRYAHERSSGALFGFSTNYRLFAANKGASMGLFGRFIVIGLLNGVVSSALNSIFSGMYNVNAYYFQPSTGYWLMFALTTVVSYTVTLVFTLSQYQLMYQFGLQLGIGHSGKGKPTDDKYAF